VDFVDEQNITRLQIGQDRGEITCARDHGARCLPKPNTQFRGHNLRQRGLAQTRRAVKQDMIHRFAPLLRRLNADPEVPPQALLPHEFIEQQRAKALICG